MNKYQMIMAAKRALSPRQKEAKSYIKTIDKEKKAVKSEARRAFLEKKANGERTSGKFTRFFRYKNAFTEQAAS